MPDLGTAYVQIVPSAQGIKGSITKELGGEAGSAGKSAGSLLGGSLVSTIKKVVIAAGVGKILKDAFTAGGNLEQSFGGLETIYGSAADAAKSYALAAAQAGISANDYAEQAVSFGASLKQAFEGDVVAAAEAANTAIMDMADNSAKMGTDIGSIQAAYQGFAKQNYTMLDNLKLGYGGTKTEMQRLLADAEKISGIKYDIDNLGDVYDAIHVIQGELGLTGVAANEAKSTLTGSAAAMKASWQNLLAAMTTGEGLSSAMSNLGESVGNFAVNVVRMAKNIGKQLPSLFNSLFTTIGPELLSLGASLVTDLGSGLIKGIPQLLSVGAKLITSFLATVRQNGPGLIAQGANLIKNLAIGFVQSIPGLISTLGSLLLNLVGTILSLIPSFLSAGIDLILSLASGIIESWPDIQAAVNDVISQAVAAIRAKVGEWLAAGQELLENVKNGIKNKLSAVRSAAISVITSAVNAIKGKASQFLSAGRTLIQNVINGIKGLVGAARSAASSVVQNIRSAFSVDFSSLGSNIISGIISGIAGGVGSLISAVRAAALDALRNAKDALGIKSPSKVFAEEVGKWIPAGIAVGIDTNLSPVNKSVNSVVDLMLGDFNRATMRANSVGNQNGLDMNRLATAINERPVNVNVALQGDAGKLFRYVSKENNVRTKTTGYNSFAMVGGY